MLFYSADHYADLKKVNPGLLLRKRFQQINGLMIAGSAAGLGVTWLLYFQVYEYSKFWLLAAPIFLYFLGAFRLVIVYRGIRELLISMVVALAVFYPVLQPRQFHTFIPALPFALVCATNLISFSWFELEKDEYFGFPSLFVHIPQPKLKKIIYAFFLIVAVCIYWISLAFNISVVGHLLAVLLYFAFVNTSQLWNKHPLYRWLNDFTLLLVLL